jgi:hypothetical protein
VHTPHAPWTALEFRSSRCPPTLAWGGRL